MLVLPDDSHKPSYRVLELIIPTLPALVTDFNTAVSRETKKKLKKTNVQTATACLPVDLPPPTAGVCEFSFFVHKKRRSLFVNERGEQSVQSASA